MHLGQDVHVKAPLYRDLGILEFWWIDPDGCLDDGIEGFRLDDGIYRGIRRRWREATGTTF